MPLTGNYNQTSTIDASGNSLSYLQTWMERKFISNLRTNNVFRQFGTPPTRSTKGYQTLMFPRAVRSNVTPAQALLVEGVTPAPNAANFVQLKVETISVQPEQFGLVGSITDVLDAMSALDLISTMSTELGDNMGRIMDKAIQAVLTTGASNKSYQGGGANLNSISSTDYLDPVTVGDIETYLSTQGAKRYGNYFVAIGDYNVINGFRRDPAVGGWIDAHKYANPSNLFNGEIGEFNGVRFVRTNNIDPVTNSHTPSGGGTAVAVKCYPTFFLGKDAYGISELQNLRSYFVPFRAEKTDPLAQLAYVGFKVMFKAVVLQQQAMVVHYAAAPTNFAWASLMDGTVAL